MKNVMFSALICCGAWWPFAPANAATLPPVPLGVSDAYYIPGVTAKPITFVEAAEPIDLITGVNSRDTLVYYMLREDGGDQASDYVYTDIAGRIHFASADENGEFKQETKDWIAEIKADGTVKAPSDETGDWVRFVFAGLNVGDSPIEIYVVSDPTPLPAALPLFATGLGMMGLLGWRRKRNVTAAIAAA